MPWIMQGTLAAAGAGVGCGSCCGSGISAALFGYLTTHTGSIRRTLQAFLAFYLGKILTVAAICLGSSLLGRCIFGVDGSIGIIPLEPVVDLVMILTGTVLTVNWSLEKNRGKQHAACGNCGEKCHCGEIFHGNHLKEKGPEGRVSAGLLFTWGVGYGISPCAPLIFMAGYCAALSPVMAVWSGTVFAVSSALVPMILVLAFSGVLSPRLFRELPEYIDRFRVAVYLILTAMFAWNLAHWVFENGNMF